MSHVGRPTTWGLSLVLLATGACGGGEAGSGPDGSGTPDTGPTTEVTCQELTPPASGLCTVTPGSSGLLLRGTVLAPGTVYRGGALAVDPSGVITCVGCDCAAPEATTVTCARGVISPGRPRRQEGERVELGQAG